MVFAMTFEQAMNYVPPTAAVKDTTDTTPIASGERIRTSRYWQTMPRSEFGFNKSSRSWKRHRRTQRGSLRI